MPQALLCLIIILSTTQTPLHAQTKIYGLSIPNRLSPTGQDHYNLLWQSFAKQGLQFELKVVPSKRLVRDFLQETTACSFPVQAAIIKRKSKNKNIALISSDFVDYPGMMVYTRQPNPSSAAPFSLSGKRLAGSFGFDPKIVLDESSLRRFAKAKNAEVLLKMLYKKRVDAILAFSPDILITANKLDLPTPHATGLWVFAPQGVGLVCHSTPANKRFIEKFNRKLQLMRDSG